MILDGEPEGGRRRTPLTSAAIPPPRFPYSPCVRIGPITQVSGMVGLAPGTGDLVPGGPGAETSRILANLKLAIPDFGVSMDELLIARIYTTEFDQFEHINAAWNAAFDGHGAPPARTAVGVTALPLGATVEIEFTFVGRPERSR